MASFLKVETLNVLRLHKIFIQRNFEQVFVNVIIIYLSFNKSCITLDEE